MESLLGSTWLNGWLHDFTLIRSAPNLSIDFSGEKCYIENSQLH
ncbi:hypothetical protein HMPREF0262_00769 [Clostridium sp. ATCC 29733]|nr:hypothetical protein HMPREF0262_00769 [Clostridium sp. ATCC 29733]